MSFRSLIVASILSVIGCSGTDPVSVTASDDSGASADVAIAEASQESQAEAAVDAPLGPVAYATKVVSHVVGEKGGNNEDKLPDIVLGPPHGNGCCAGSLDVYSLGNGGEIVLGFDVAIVDGPGTDFLVFENAFEIAGDPTNILAEPGEVAVSEDGETWVAFPCTAKAYPYGTCAGWHPAYASADQPIDPAHPEAAGGDPFDLAMIGVKKARFVRIRDMNAKIAAAAPTAGFDLDGIAALHFE
ncbi:MAG: hypothetical protein ACXVEE_22490 [Polyangiales bacterium]